MSKLCTDAEFLTTVEVGQFFLTKDTEEFSQFTDSEYTLPRDESLSEPKAWIRGNTKIGPVLEVTTCCLQGKYGVEIRIESMNKDPGNFRNVGRRLCVKHRMQVILRADQKPERNHKDVLLPAHPQKLYLLEKELGPILNHKIIRSPIIQCRRNWFIFFVMGVYLEKTMERLNSGAQKTILRNISCIVIIGLTTSGRASWQEEEGTRKCFSVVLILQEKFFTSELFKVIQDAILLILHYRTMSWFRTISSSTFVTLDVQSIYIPSSIQDWYREVKIWATDRQYSFYIWILWTNKTRILRRSTWKHRVLHGTCTQHGRNIKTLCIGSTSNLLKRKRWKFYQTRSNAIILYNTRWDRTERPDQVLRKSIHVSLLTARTPICLLNV